MLLPKQSLSHRFTESGEALVEVLVTLVIIGLTVTTILGALLTSTSASVEHRNLATLDGALTSFADAARNTIETQVTNGSSGPTFSPCAIISASSSPYQVSGAPNPGAGPTGAAVAVLGLGYGSVTNATISGTSGGTIYTESVPATYTGDHAGAISIFNVPDGSHLLSDGVTMDTALPAGSYQLAPFGAGSQAAATFTVTPWVGAMAPKTPGSVGPGSSVTVSVSGFLAGTTLTVKVGTASAGGLSNNITSANNTAPGAKPGTTTLTFQIPAGLSGVQSVTISDGTNTSLGVSLNLASDTALANPPFSTSTLASYVFTASSNVWNSGWLSSASVGACTGAGYNPSVQQLTFKLTNPQKGSGSFDSASVVLSNFGDNTTAAPPVNVVAVGGMNQVSLTWTAPSFTNGVSISGYNVYHATSASGPFTKVNPSLVTSPAYTDTGLTGGTPYYYEVTTVTAKGEGPGSAVQTATTLSLPGAPTGLSATGGNGQISLSWTAPTSNGGSAITGYNVYRSPPGCGTFSQIATGVTATSYTNTSLGNSVTFCYQVTAVTSVGQGPASNQASATTNTVPGAPTMQAPTVGNTQVTLNWTAPASNGGSAITDYLVFWRQGTSGSFTQIDTGSTNLTYTQTGRTNGVLYQYFVEAVNANGTGPQSNQVSATPDAVPGAPTMQSPTPGDTQVKLTWTAPAPNGGSAITDYYVFYRQGTSGPFTQVDTGGTSTTYIQTGLTDGSSYQFYVEAVNTIGPGAQSNQVSATPSTTPGAPTLGPVTQGPTHKLNLSWSVPASNGGSAITDYYVFYRQGTSGTFTMVDTNSSGTTYQKAGLVSGDSYQFYVEAVNANGPGPQSNTVSGTAP